MEYGGGGEASAPPCTFLCIFVTDGTTPPRTGYTLISQPVVDLTREAFPHRFSTSEEPEMLRVLITVEPRMYREALALTVRSHRPGTEILLVSEAALDGQVDGFDPQLLVRNDGGAAFPEELLGSVVCRVDVLYTDSMAARVAVGDRSFEIEDACVDDLISLVDEAEDFASVSPAEGASPGRA